MVNSFLINYNNNIEVFLDKGILLYISPNNNSPYIINNIYDSDKLKIIKNTLNAFYYNLSDNSEDILLDIKDSFSINHVEVLFDNYHSIICKNSLFLYIDDSLNSLYAIPCNTKLSSIDFDILIDKFKKSFVTYSENQKLIG